MTNTLNENNRSPVPVAISGITNNCAFAFSVTEFDLQLFSEAGGFTFLPPTWEASSKCGFGLPVGSLSLEFLSPNDGPEYLRLDQNCLRAFWTRARGQFGKHHSLLMKQANNLVIDAEEAAINHGLSYDTEAGTLFGDEWLSKTDYDQISCQAQSLWTMSIVISSLIECERSHGKMANLAEYLTG